MRIENPFQMNNWKPKKFFTVVISLLLFFWGAVLLDIIGLNIPIIRQLFSFICILFIPGILILRVLKLYNLGNAESFLYAVGLSLSFLMFLGLFINKIGPFLGIYHPMSPKYYVILFSTVTVILCFLCYKINTNLLELSFIDASKIFSAQTLYLLLLPLLAIIGTYLVNFYQNNILLLFVIILIVFTVLITTFYDVIPKELYPLAVFSISLSLLFHNSLISMYVTGWDIQLEYYTSNLVVLDSYWNSSLASNVNAMLSIVMLAPIFSYMTNMKLVWVFKILYPFIFSLLPVGLYEVYRKQTSDKISFLSVFFFMSLFVFYTEMLQLARQQIAEFYLVLILLLIQNQNINRMKKSFLMIIFGFSLALSHYGLSYIFMGSMILEYFFVYIYSSFSKYKNNYSMPNFTVNFVILYVIFSISWYLFISSSSSIDSIVRISSHIIDNVYTEFLNPSSSEGLLLILKSTHPSIFHQLGKLLHLCSQFFIFIGIISSLFFKDEYIKFRAKSAPIDLIYFLILIAGIVIPFFASSLNTSRLYHISLIFLSPYCVIGGIIFAKMIIYKFRFNWMEISSEKALNVLSVFFAIFFIFNCGLIYEVINDEPTSVSLSNIDYPCFNEQEAIGCSWLYSNKNNNGCIFADFYRYLLFSSKFEKSQLSYVSNEVPYLKGHYTFFGTRNILENQVLISQKEGVKNRLIYVNLNNLPEYKNKKIYSNGGSQIYYT